MSRVVQAVLLSLLLHCALAGALAFALSRVSEPDALARLDLSSVELSFAEEERETLPARPVPAGSVPRQEKSVPVPEKREAPSVDDVTPPLPPVPEAVPLPQPDSAAPPVFEPPPVRPPEPREDAVEETRKPTSAETSDAVSAPGSVPQAAAPRQARIDAQPKLRQRLKPDYPADARRRGEEGDVALEIEVTDRGRVEAVRVVRSSGFPDLDAAAVKAVRKARLTPAKAGDRSVASTARLTVRFRLRE